MLATTGTMSELTAGDLMSRDLVSVSSETPLREAGRLLLLHQISGLPVVEPGGTCIGVLSTTDILRWAVQQSGGPRSRTFSIAQLPTEKVGNFMTPDPLIVAANTPATELARQMVNAHVHRVVVVDHMLRPVGIVSSTDMLAGMACD